MSKNLEETVTFHCIQEDNDWEGETWYHYFLDEPGVLDILDRLIDVDEDNDYVDLETVILTWPEATRLTSMDHGGYMQEHWFGKLTKPEELKGADQKALYKGGIRDFDEELFSYESEDNSEEDSE